MLWPCRCAPAWVGTAGLATGLCFRESSGATVASPWLSINCLCQHLLANLFPSHTQATLASASGVLLRSRQGLLGGEGTWGLSHCSFVSQAYLVGLCLVPPSSTSAPSSLCPSLLPSPLLAPFSKYLFLHSVSQSV